MATTFDVQGFEELTKKLESMGKKGAKIEDEALQKAAEPILQDAKSTTAFKDVSGKLRKSLKISKVKKNKGIKFVWVGDVDKQANYSWYVEYGDARSAERPFLRPAYDRNKKQVFEIIKNEIANELKK